MSGARLAFVGDIHGMAGQLSAVLDALGGSRHLVFLGDYVNRGPNSNTVLQTLLTAVDNWPNMITLLRGNHDQELLDFLISGNLARFVSFGGLHTIASYTEQGAINSIRIFKESFPPSHLDLLANLEDYFERDDVFASHCGPNPDNPASRERSDVVMGSHLRLFRLDVQQMAGKVVVCGHYVQRPMVAFAERGLYAIDTGCGSLAAGPLTVLLWPEKKLVQFGVADARRH